jgi:surface antigen
VRGISRNRSRVLFLYKATALTRLWYRFPAVAVIALALASGGCSFSYQLGALFGKDDDRSETGSVGAQALERQALEKQDLQRQDLQRQEVQKFASEPLPEGDLAYARAAASEMLSRGDKQDSADWENPATGARGMVTPIASAYTQDGLTCRDFLASYVHDGNEAWLQGEACRRSQGNWEVKSLKPWKRV